MCECMETKKNRMRRNILCEETRSGCMNVGNYKENGMRINIMCKEVWGGCLNVWNPKENGRRRNVMCREMWDGLWGTLDLKYNWMGRNIMCRGMLGWIERKRKWDKEKYNVKRDDGFNLPSNITYSSL